jgi:hypothetical protein
LWAWSSSPGRRVWLLAPEEEGGWRGGGEKGGGSVTGMGWGGEKKGEEIHSGMLLCCFPFFLSQAFKKKKRFPNATSAISGGRPWSQAFSVEAWVLSGVLFGDLFVRGWAFGLGPRNGGGSGLALPAFRTLGPSFLILRRREGAAADGMRMGCSVHQKKAPCRARAGLCAFYAALCFPELRGPCAPRQRWDLLWGVPW